MTPLVSTRGWQGDAIAVARKLAEDTALVLTRGWQTDYRARRRQAPLSGRQGAIGNDVTRTREERPGDAIAVARKLAEDTA